MAIYVYGVTIQLASPFSDKAKQWVAGRKIELHSLPEKKGKRIWFHCASLGEFEQARPVIENWGGNHPDDLLILSFFSPSGYEVRKNYNCVDAVVYLPLDTKTGAKMFLDWAKPDVSLFVKYEFWFHYLNELKRRNIPTILFSSIFRREQVFFKWYGAIFRQMLNMFSKILVQSEDSVDLLKTISVPSEVCLDTRFDRVKQIVDERRSYSLVERFKGDKKVVIAGSTWKRDEQLILSVINGKQLKGCKFIIAPHEIDSASISELQKKILAYSVLFSDLNELTADSSEVLIVDSIGDLASLYQYGDFVYVGGGFNVGVHNVLEVAVQGVPIFWGPRYQKSLEAIELINRGGAFSVSSDSELLKIISRLIGDPKETFQFRSNRDYVLERTGGTQKVLMEISIALNK
ncbi:MAG: 3-deoxy-D-manno-octulosonic acid transferase [Bacteroidetes bacterium]|nr:3-deoxy-D-manno-octulosonic acid transferase [Bacteroidota bacterium]